MQEKLRANKLEIVRQDIRYVLRGVRRSPGLFIALVTTLALGVGANGALFSLLDRLYLRPPAGVASPEQLYRLYFEIRTPPPAQSFIRTMFAYPEAQAIAGALPRSVRMAVFAEQEVPMGTSDESALNRAALVGGDYFGLLGVTPALGRFFAPEELQVEASSPVAVLSHRLWQRRFFGDSSVLGSRISIASRSYTIIGVAASGFDGINLSATDVWIPLNHLTQPGLPTPWHRSRLEYTVQLLLRIPPTEHVSSVIQRAHVGLTPGTTEKSPLLAGPILEARGPRDSGLEARIATSLVGVTLLVLLVALSNVANLFLARSIQRQHEIAIRLALGVSRARLAGQVLIESLILALASAAAALAVSWAGGESIRRLLMPDTQWSGSPINARVTILTAGITIVALLLMGFLLFVRSWRPTLSLSIRGAAGESDARGSRLRGTLVVVQAAFSVVLIAGAGLFLHSVEKLQQLNIGFEPAQLISVGLASGTREIDRFEQGRILAEVAPRVAVLPGVRAVAFSNARPLGGLSFTALFFPGRTAPPRNEQGIPTYLAVSPSYFATTGIQVVAGRSFVEADNASAPRVVMVNTVMAQLAWPGENALGKCIRLDKADAPCATVVGVVANARRASLLEKPTMLFYIPTAQGIRPMERAPSTLLLRGEPKEHARIIAEVRAMLRLAAPGVRPVLTPMTQTLAAQTRPWRIGAQLFTLCGVLALIVSALGIFSAVSYAISQRTREIGVRLALGATAADIGRLVIATAVRWAAIGVAVGIAIALAGGRFVESLLYDTSARDPVVLSVSGAVLLAVAVLAALVPARRAIIIDPVRTLRGE